MLNCGRRRNLVPLPASSTKGGERGVLKAPGLDQEERQATQLFGPASKTNHKVLRTHSSSFWCWDKPRATLDSFDSPRPGLGGSHHLPLYSIFCVRPRRLHPNGIFSRDSQSGIPKLSRFGLPGLWVNITSCLDLRSGRGQPNLQPSSRAFQCHVALHLMTLDSGRFPTFSGRKSNYQFDSRPFFCP